MATAHDNRSAVRVRGCMACARRSQLRHAENAAAALTGALVLVFIAACAVNPSAERADGEYRRDNGRVEAMEKFEELKRRCASAGGVIQVYRSSSGRFPPTTDELRLATCGPSP